MSEYTHYRGWKIERINTGRKYGTRSPAKYQSRIDIKANALPAIKRLIDRYEDGVDAQ